MRIARRRLIGAAIIATTSVAALAGCSSSAASSTPTAESGPITLTLGNSQWLDTTRGAALWDAMQKYEKAAPNVSVKQEAIPSTEISTKLTTELGAGTGPDIMFIQDDLFESFVDAEYLAPIPESVTKGVNLNSTNEGAIVKGKRYGVAWQRAPFGLLYNKQLLDEAGVSVPKNTDELIAAAEKIKQITGKSGFGDQSITAGGNIWNQMLDTWTYGEGGSWATDKGKLTIDSAANVKGVTNLVKADKAGIFSTDPFATMRTAFSQGQVGMMSEIGGGAIVAEKAGVIPAHDVLVAPNAQSSPGFHQQLYVAINKNSKHVQAALDFVKWLIGSNGQTGLRAASGSDPLATDVPIPAAYSADNPWATQFLELGKTSRSTLIPGHETQTTQIMQIIVQHVQQAVAGTVSPKAALQAAQAEAAALG